MAASFYRDELTLRIERELQDGLDEELELEIEDRSSDVVAAEGLTSGSPADERSERLRYFKDLFHLLIEVAPDEATRQIMVRALEDEARHVAYGVGRLRTQLATQRDPDTVGQGFVDALEARLAFTYEVSGLPRHVQEALAILAGGDRGPGAPAAGRERIREFVDELNRNRKERLLQSGFSERLAETISQLHIRTSGGLM